MTRKFAVANGFEDKGVVLPERSTKYSAGYDLCAAEDVTVPSIFLQLLFKWKVRGTLVPTGIKIKMPNDEYAALMSRSSTFNKTGLMLANNYAVIDSDYYESRESDGQVSLNFINFNVLPVKIKKGDRLCQVVFHKYAITSVDTVEKIREGGIGSTDQNGARNNE